MGKYKAPSGPFSKPGSSINVSKVHSAAAIADNAHIVFSFKYLDFSDSGFAVAGRDSAYFLKLFERKQAICRMTLKELRNPKNAKPLRAHDIAFEKTSRSGFPNGNEKLGTPFQFGLSANEHGRVHGFFIGSTFYVVWLDPEHVLYPGG